MTFLTSENNLESGTISFINDSDEVTIFSAYITLNQLKKLNNSNRISRVITRWEIEDLVRGASDLEVYNYCVNHKITLYRNTRLHMKALWNNKESILFGSANVTSKGIGESTGICNLELCGISSNLDLATMVYLNRTISRSEYVGFDLYNKIKKLVRSVEIQASHIPRLPSKETKVDRFLISQLPVTESPTILFSRIEDDSKAFDIALIAHDLATYDINPNLKEDDFFKHIKKNFNTHPFIKSFKNAVRNSNRKNDKRKASMSFGQARKWFAENTTTVPTPRPWDLNENIQILYTWICYFDPCFSWSIPGSHSQVIRYCEH